jgi:GAF domain-containing protein
VLTEVVESARTLTGARFGAIATIDETGTPRDFVTSGFTEEEHRRLAEWADGPRLFEHFRDLEGPLRIADVPAYVRALGFPTDRLPSKTFQGMPMRHRGVHVGNFYLVEKAGGAAFTDEDEQILVLFAAQAATAIANARTYRAEWRAATSRR